MSAVEVKPTGGAGAEVLGVDIRTMTDDEFAQMRQAFADHGVIFLRDQDITPEEHIAFAERWGQINVNRFFTAHDDHPKIAMVVKEPDQTHNIGGGWHADHSYDVEPALGSILVARELPVTGGDTAFASMYAAYEGLDPDLKAHVDTLHAVHSAHHIFGSKSFYGNREDQSQGRIGNADKADRLPDVIHPVVITHPLSGRKALYVNPGFTISIQGMSEEDSKAMLEQLYLHAVQPEFTHEFDWKPGSIAFWDNRAVWHSARNDYQGQRRVMHRITIEGCALSA